MMAVVRKHSWNSNLMLEFSIIITGDIIMGMEVIQQTQLIMDMTLPL